jgi:hypothetical protein
MHLLNLNPLKYSMPRLLLVYMSLVALALPMLASAAFIMIGVLL